MMTLILLAIAILQTPPPPSGAITGRVVDGVSGRPVAAALVSIGGPQLLGESALPRVLTDAGGRFVFTRLTPGVYTVTARKGGYADGEPRLHRPGGMAPPVLLTPAEMSTAVTIPMWRYSAISGTVLDEAGEPIVNLQVRALRRTSATARSSIAASTLTDDRGAYRFGALFPGDYIVVASPDAGSAMPAQRPGRHVQLYPPTFYPSSLSPTQASRITLATGEERIGVDVQIVPVAAARVAGVLLNGGSPATTATLRLVPVGSENLPADVVAPASVTDGAGSFTFGGVVPGRYRLRGSSTGGSGLAWVDLPIAVSEEDIDNIAVIMNPALRITGRFQFDGSSPLPALGSRSFSSMPFALEPVDGFLDGISTAGVVGEQGVVTWVGYLPGRYRVTVKDAPPGWMLKAAMLAGVDVSETPFDFSKDVTLDLVYTDRVSGVNGRVEGKTADVASVLLFTTDTLAWTDASPSSRRFRAARVNTTGAFVINGVPPGDYYLVAVPEDQAADWRDASTLEVLARVATLIAIGEGETKTASLTVRDVR